MCALTSSFLDDFSSIVTYILYLGWKLGIFFFGGGGEASTPQIP